MARAYDRDEELLKFYRSIGKPEPTEEAAEPLVDIYDDAMSEVLGYCNRDEVVPGVATSIRDLAKIRYNQEGAEGESSRSEGGVSQSYEEGIPRRIRSVLNRYRQAKVRRLN